MVSSMVEVRSQGVRLTGQGKASIAPSMVSGNTKPLHSAASLKPASLPQGVYSVSKTQLAKGQQQVTSVQIAQQALQQVGRELVSMKKVLGQALKSNQPVSEATVRQVSSQQQNIRQTLENATSDGARVLDSQLRVQLEHGAERTFTIPGLNLSRQRQQNEQIRLDFPQTGTVVINFTSQSSDKQLVDQIDRSLIPMGVRAAATEEGELIFRTKDADFNQMKQQVMVTGQGHRYPAGQPNVVKLQPEPEGVEDLAINLGNRDGIRQTVGKVNQHLRQVQQSLDDIKAYQSELAKQMAQFSAQGNLGDMKAIQGKLDTFSRKTNAYFTTTYQAVSAQANVHRHTVVALLR